MGRLGYYHHDLEMVNPLTKEILTNKNRRVSPEKGKIAVRIGPIHVEAMIVKVEKVSYIE